MSTEQETRTVREAVGIFHRAEDLQGAFDELLSSGFHRAELSLLAGEHAVEEKLGHRYQKVSALADDPTVPRAAYVSTEAVGGAEGGLIGGLTYVGAVVAAGAIVASGCTLAAVTAAAALAGGAGGLIGSVLAKWVAITMRIICKNRSTAEPCCYGCEHEMLTRKNAPSRFLANIRATMFTFMHCRRRRSAGNRRQSGTMSCCRSAAFSASSG